MASGWPRVEMLGGSEPGPETQQEMVELAKAAEREQEELRRLEDGSQEREEQEEHEEGGESETASQEASLQASQEPSRAEEFGQPRPLSTQDVERHRTSWPGVPGNASEPSEPEVLSVQVSSSQMVPVKLELQATEAEHAGSPHAQPLSPAARASQPPRR